MTLQELVASTAVISEDGGDASTAQTETGTYVPSADQYTLFCEQYLERPALLKDDGSSIAARATDSLTYGDTHVSRDD